MCNWRQRLSALVAARESVEYPLFVFRVRPPDPSPWPAGLPSSDAIREFYGLCDGGVLSLEASWFAKHELIPRRDDLRGQLFDYRGDGKHVLHPERHVVLGEDSAGAPLIWDAESGELSTFYWKGGDWEPWGLSVDAYLQRLFCDESGDELWANALRMPADATKE